MTRAPGSRDGGSTVPLALVQYGGCADRGDAPEGFNSTEWAWRGIAAGAVRRGEGRVPLGNRWPVPRDQTIGDKGPNRLWPNKWRTRRAFQIGDNPAETLRGRGKKEKEKGARKLGTSGHRI